MGRANQRLMRAFGNGLYRPGAGSPDDPEVLALFADPGAEDEGLAGGLGVQGMDAEVVLVGVDQPPQVQLQFDGHMGLGGRIRRRSAGHRGRGPTAR